MLTNLAIYLSTYKSKGPKTVSVYNKAGFDENRVDETRPKRVRDQCLVHISGPRPEFGPYLETKTRPKLNIA